MSEEPIDDEKAIISAAARFKRAWDLAMARDGEGLILADLDIVEVHEAALDLIRTTGTDNLEAALDTFRQYDV